MEQPLGLDYSKCLCVGHTSFTKVQEQPSNIMPFLFKEWRKKKVSFGFTHRESRREREREQNKKNEEEEDCCRSGLWKEANEKSGW